jgi:alanine dehydrogenase
MRIGIPKETFPDEKRVALAPAGVNQLVNAGHTVYIETMAGSQSKFCDDDYERVGAKIVYTHAEAFQRADIVAKVAPLNSEEVEFLEEGQILFSFLHMAYSRGDVMRKVIEKKITAIAYEFIGENGYFPILETMSEIAGKLAIQVGERYLGSDIPSSRGILIGGLPGVAPAAVVIIGAGIVGFSAARAALGRGAQVIVLDEDIHKLRRIESTLGQSITTVAANSYTIARGVKFADILVGAVQVSGGKSSHLVSEDLVKTMKKGAVIVDVSIDQGGCVETSRPTTISEPIFVKHNVIHYCVPNMPAIVSRSASYGLTNSSIKILNKIADNGFSDVLLNDIKLANGVWSHNGFCPNEFLSETFGLNYKKLRIFPTN